MDVLKTRRRIILENIRAIAVLSVSATAAGLGGTMPARADRYGDHGGDRYGEDSGGRYGEDGGDRYGEDGGDHDGDHGGHGHGDHGDHGGHEHGGHGGHGGGRGGACFLRGTHIRTADGERCIEDLKPGDLLPTHFKGLQPIQRIERWRYSRGKIARWKKQLMPVRVVKSALAHNVPHSDLYLTQGHALFVDGILIPAGALVNGATITLHPAHENDVFDIFNIRLAQHDVIYAEGAPCETLLQSDHASTNFAKYLRRFGVGSTQPAHCAPIYCNGRFATINWATARIMRPWIGPHKVDVIRKHLAKRADLRARSYVWQQGLIA